LTQIKKALPRIVKSLIEETTDATHLVLACGVAAILSLEVSLPV
jgi:hypothetical protein